jgi:transcriptional regulator with XRE-family HTH domain
MIGSRIRAFRLDKGLTLSELARRAGVSKSLVSQIENSKANPTVETLRAIAAALEVPVFALFLEEDSSHSAVVRKNERITLTVPDSQAVRELLTPDLQRAMVLLISRIPPGATSSPSAVSHKGEECVFILRGNLVVHLQDETHLLKAGDFLYFDSRLPHFFANRESTEVEFICAISPASLPPHS